MDNRNKQPRIRRKNNVDDETKLTIIGTAVVIILLLTAENKAERIMILGVSLAATAGLLIGKAIKTITTKKEEQQ